MNNVDCDSKVCEKDKYGNLIPVKTQKPAWKFGDSLKKVKPNKLKT